MSRTLLLNEELKATITTKESTIEYCLTHNIVAPNKLQPKYDSSTDTGGNLEHILSNNLLIIIDEPYIAVRTAGDCMKALFSSKLL